MDCDTIITNSLMVQSNCILNESSGKLKVDVGEERVGRSVDEDQTR